MPIASLKNQKKTPKLFYSLRIGGTLFTKRTRSTLLIQSGWPRSCHRAEGGEKQSESDAYSSSNWSKMES
jgi:hypothetical protein